MYEMQGEEHLGTIRQLRDEDCRLLEVHGYDYSYYEIDSILLTDSWLERFGFEYSEILTVWTLSGSIILSDFKFVLGLQHVQIEYVHQLQNIYFALTGVEL